MDSKRLLRTLVLRRALEGDADPRDLVCMATSTWRKHRNSQKRIKRLEELFGLQSRRVELLQELNERLFHELDYMRSLVGLTEDYEEEEGNYSPVPVQVVTTIQRRPPEGGQGRTIPIGKAPVDAVIPVKPLHECKQTEPKAVKAKPIEPTKRGKPRAGKARARELQQLLFSFEEQLEELKREDAALEAREKARKKSKSANAKAAFEHRQMLHTLKDLRGNLEEQGRMIAIGEVKKHSRKSSRQMVAELDHIRMRRQHQKEVKVIPLEVPGDVVWHPHSAEVTSPRDERKEEEVQEPVTPPNWVKRTWVARVPVVLASGDQRDVPIS